MSITFTQYLRPNGRKRRTKIDRPPDIEELANQFIAAGGWYESEELNTGHASLTACFVVDNEQKDIAIEVCKNGPEVPAAVDRLVRKSIAYITVDQPGPQTP